MGSSPPAEGTLQEALARLSQDGIVAYPTETVWGLGACADRPRAVDRLMAWKGRASNAPLAVLIPDVATAESIGCELRTPVRTLIEAFWPGPLMIVVPCRKSFAPGVARSDGALGLRCSPHPIAAALAEGAKAAGLGPLTSTSLNRSGEPPAETLDEARQLIAKEAAGEGKSASETPYLVSTAESGSGAAVPSTVVDCTGDSFSILREGAIETEAIRRVWQG